MDRVTRRTEVVTLHSGFDEEEEEDEEKEEDPEQD